MSREDRIARATELLTDIAEKQLACNKVIGLSFKDIDRVLKAVIAEKKSAKSDEDDERFESPEKWGDRPESPVRESPVGSSPFKSETGLPFTRDEVAWLLAQRDIILSETNTRPNRNYATYREHEVDALIKGKCHPSIFNRRSRS